MAKYKIWLHIEEIGNEDENEYRDIGMPVEMAQCDTLKQAERAVDLIVDLANAKETNQ